MSKIYIREDSTHSDKISFTRSGVISGAPAGAVRIGSPSGPILEAAFSCASGTRTIFAPSTVHRNRSPTRSPSSRYISEYEARESEQLTREELHAIFKRSGLNQKDFAEALGLGEKTFHRWLKGTQVVSRSMGYYLRAMDRFPEPFDWVKIRAWRKPIPRRAARTPAAEPVFAPMQRRSDS